MNIGCHISIRNGFLAAAQTAKSLGCSAFQYFPKNPRSLSIKSYDSTDAARCRDFCTANELVSVTHTPYPVNLATDDRILAQAVKHSLLNDLNIADACGSAGVVVHFGKFSEKLSLQGYRNIIQLLNNVLRQWSGRAMLLIENQAAGMGTTLEELVQVRSLTEYPDKIGFCLDTCHAFAGGMWSGDNWRQIEDRGRELDYFSHLRVIHLNDSRYPFGSNKDFHANIGRGYIGDRHFRKFLHSPAVRHLPVILETPSNPAFTVSQEIEHVKELADD